MKEYQHGGLSLSDGEGQEEGRGREGLPPPPLP